MLMTIEMVSKWDKKISDQSLDIAVLCYLDDATLSAPKLPNNTRVTCLLTAKDFPFSMMDRGGKTKPAPLFVRLATGRVEEDRGRRRRLPR